MPAAWAAVSGAITPSISPLPNFAPFFDNVAPFMRAVSAAACSADLDDDGRPDLFMVQAGSGEQNALFKNTSTPGTISFARWPMPATRARPG